MAPIIAGALKYKWQIILALAVIVFFLVAYPEIKRQLFNPTLVGSNPDDVAASSTGGKGAIAGAFMVTDMAAEWASDGGFATTTHIVPGYGEREKLLQQAVVLSPGELRLLNDAFNSQYAKKLGRSFYDTIFDSYAPWSVPQAAKTAALQKLAVAGIKK